MKGVKYVPLWQKYCCCNCYRAKRGCWAFWTLSTKVLDMTGFPSSWRFLCTRCLLKLAWRYGESS